MWFPWKSMHWFTVIWFWCLDRFCCVRQNMRQNIYEHKHSAATKALAPAPPVAKASSNNGTIVRLTCWLKNDKVSEKFAKEWARERESECGMDKWFVWLFEFGIVRHLFHRCNSNKTRFHLNPTAARPHKFYTKLSSFEFHAIFFSVVVVLVLFLRGGGGVLCVRAHKKKCNAVVWAAIGCTGPKLDCINIASHHIHPVHWLRVTSKTVVHCNLLVSGLFLWCRSLWPDKWRGWTKREHWIREENAKKMNEIGPQRAISQKRHRESGKMKPVWDWLTSFPRVGFWRDSISASSFAS